MQELGKLLPPLWGEVYGWLANKGLKPAGAPLWRYRVIGMAAKLGIGVGVPEIRAPSSSLRVSRISASLGTGSPEGWLCATTKA